jgi:hypothetical protein
MFDVSLPHSYPSESPPAFEVACDWLNVSQLSEVCRELDRIWRDNDNMPVIFTWVEWLSSSLVEFLDLVVEPSTVVITPVTCGGKFEKESGASQDVRAISLFVDVDGLIFKFLR